MKVSRVCSVLFIRMFTHFSVGQKSVSLSKPGKLSRKAWGRVWVSHIKSSCLCIIGFVLCSAKFASSLSLSSLSFGMSFVSDLE